MKKLHEKTTVFAAILIAFLCAVQLFASTYAWLVNFVKGGDFGFSANELPPYKLEIACIPYSEDSREETKRLYSACDNYKIKADDNGAHLAVKIENMTFGTIDNVAQLKPENIVYLRLTVPKACGDTLNLNLHYNRADFITLYQKIIDDNTGEISVSQVTDEDIINNLIAVESENNANDCFLLYDAVVSNQEWQANEIAEEVDFDQNTDKYSRFYVNGTTPETLTNDYFDQVKDNYYVYIKVIPNLSVFAYSIEHLTAVMPCYMYFAIGAVFDSANPTKPLT